MGEVPDQNASQFTSYILFFYVSSTTNEGLQNQPSDWWSPSCGNDILYYSCLSIVGAIHRHTSDDLPHPVQDKLPH